MNDIKELKAALKDAQIKGKTTEITAIRGRLIRKVRQELNRIKRNGTPEEKEEISQLEELLSNSVTDHKTQLSKRYNKEFVSNPGGIIKLIASIPTAVALSVQKIATCVTSIKDAKTNKEKLFDIIDTLKAAGVLAATPLIFTGKILARHWFLTLLFLTYVFDVPQYLLEKIGGNFLHGGSLLEDVKETFQDKEELEKLAENAKERLKDIPGHLKKDFEGAKNIFIFLKENFHTIKELLSYNGGNSEAKQNIIDKLKELTSEKSPIDLTDPQKQKEAWDLFKKLKELIPGLSDSTSELSPVK